MNHIMVSLFCFIYTLPSKHGTSKEHLNRLKPSLPQKQRTVEHFFGGGKKQSLKVKEIQFAAYIGVHTSFR